MMLIIVMGEADSWEREEFSAFFGEDMCHSNSKYWLCLCGWNCVHRHKNHVQMHFSYEESTGPSWYSPRETRSAGSHPLKVCLCGILNPLRNRGVWGQSASHFRRVLLEAEHCYRCCLALQWMCLLQILLDVKNLLGCLFGFKAINIILRYSPNHVCTKISSFSSREPEGLQFDSKRIEVPIVLRHLDCHSSPL
jgi:hypothetical protein